MTPSILRLKHIRYFSHNLRTLPYQYATADTTRLTMVHFCIHALDILGALPDSYGECCGSIGGEDGQIVIPRDAIVNWIYGLQTLPVLASNADGDSCSNDEGIIQEGGGFRGGTYLGPVVLSSEDNSNNDEQQQKQQQQCYIHSYDHTHLAMTYCALCTLLALNDDLSRINRTGILQTLQSMQHSDGSFSSISPRRRVNKFGEENVKKDMMIGEGEVVNQIYVLCTLPRQYDIYCSRHPRTATKTIQSTITILTSMPLYHTFIHAYPTMVHLD